MFICKVVVKDEDKCSRLCQWCSSWGHSECAKISMEECTMLYISLAKD